LKRREGKKERKGREERKERKEREGRKERKGREGKGREGEEAGKKKRYREKAKRRELHILYMRNGISCFQAIICQKPKKFSSKWQQKRQLVLLGCMPGSGERCQVSLHSGQ